MKNNLIKSFEQCEKCGIPKYRHPYYEDCGHNFLSILDGGE